MRYYGDWLSRWMADVPWGDRIEPRLRQRLTTLGFPHLLLGIALLVGAVLRFVNLTAVPPGLNQDEAVAGYDAWSLWLTGRDHHGDPFPFWVMSSFDNWAPSLLPFLMVPVVGFFGLSVESVRGTTALLGLVAVVGVWGVSRELTGSRLVAGFAAVFAAISPWSVMNSRFALLPIADLAFGMLTLWCILRTIRTTSPYRIFWCGALAGLTVLSYQTMKLYIPLLAIAVVVVFWRELWRFPKLALVQSMLAALFLAGPSLYLSALDPATQNRIRSESLLTQHGFDLPLILRNYWTYISPGFLFRDGDGNVARSIPGYGMELPIVAPFMLLGFVVLIWRMIRPGGFLPKRSYTVFFLAAVLLAPVPAALTTQLTAQRANLLSPLIAILTAIGLVSLLFGVRWLLRRPAIRPRSMAVTGRIGRHPRVTAIGLVLLLAIVLSWPVSTRYEAYFVEYPRIFQTTAEYHSGLTDAISFALTREKEEEYDEVWIADANQGYIFLLFEGRIDPTRVHDTTLVDVDPSRNGYHVASWEQYRFTGTFAGPPDDMPVDTYDLLYQSDQVENGVFYEVREGSYEGKRILLIHSPNR